MFDPCSEKIGCNSFANLGYVIFCSVLLRKLRILGFLLYTAKRKRSDEIDKINTRAIFKVYLLSNGALWTNFTYGYNASLSVSCDGIKCCFVAQKNTSIYLLYTFFFIKSAYPGYKNKTIFSPVKQRTNHIVHISLPKGLSNALVIYRSIY